MVLKVYLCLFQGERIERSAVIPFLSLCLYHSSPYLLLLSLHLSPSSLAFLRKITTWLFTLIFQHVSECDRLSFVSHLFLSLANRSPNSSTFTMWQKGGGGGTKTNQSQITTALPGYQPVSRCRSVTSMTCTWPWTNNEERYLFTLIYATHPGSVSKWQRG